MAAPGSLSVGDRVRFIGYDGRDFGNGPLIEGTVTKVAPEHGGCTVQPDGYANSGGFGWEELEWLSSLPSRTVWSHLMGDDDFSDPIV